MGTLDGFVALSAALTGFDGDELRALGMAQEYLAIVLQQFGPGHYARLAAEPDSSEAQLQEAARAVIHLWYTGSWPGIPGRSGPFVVSPQAYASGLVWRAVGGRAPGTSPTGFGSWAEPPAGAVDRTEAG
ncbi:hypothetical protein J7E96_36045 [Streptomyces sp. ISL-96]|nr:hypothetical protein [Streptomyces sp. ISL-96]